VRSRKEVLGRGIPGKVSLPIGGEGVFAAEPQPLRAGNSERSEAGKRLYRKTFEMGVGRGTLTNGIKPLRSKHGSSDYLLRFATEEGGCGGGGGGEGKGVQQGTSTRRKRAVEPRGESRRQRKRC